MDKKGGIKTVSDFQQKEIFLENYWKAVLEQDEKTLPEFFREDALIRWHNTDEEFTVHEFVRANCEYPGEWDGSIQRMECAGDTMITAAHVHTKDGTLSFHVVSFFRMEDNRIISVDEYWGDDGPAPAWRLDKKIGRKIS